jgi:glutathione synthase/RimK-type ligase-like ATP-grasp enzyme
MRAALCTRNPKNPVIRLLARTLQTGGVEADVIADPRVVVAGGRAWDVAFWRPDSRDASIAAFSRQAAIILDGLGVPFLNSLSSMDRAGSKLVSQALFAAAGLAVIPSWLTPRPGGELEEDVEGPLIVKPLWGKGTEGVAWCPTAEKALQAAWRLGQPSLLQRPVTWRSQYRCVTASGALVRAYRDENRAPGTVPVRRFDRFSAVPEPTVEPQVAELAIAMTGAVGGDLMRADILQDQVGALWALEVNSSFGFPHDDEVVLEAFLQGFKAKAGV